MAKISLEKRFKVALKLLIAAIILFFVYRKIDFTELATVLKNTNYVFILLAIVFFALSKIVASLRLTQFLHTTNISVTEKYNLKLYWLGMFYNLFLPGGIGGDGYKIYIFKQRFKVTAKKLLWPFLLDRISGVFSLGLLLLVLAYFIDFQLGFNHKWFVPIGIILSLILARILLVKFNERFVKTFFKTLPHSIAVQGLQLISIIFILHGLKTPMGQHTEYLFTFLVSSILSIVPITPGGAGLREWTFVLGSQLFAIDKVVGIAVGSLFFFITLIVSFVGIIFHFKLSEIEEKTTEVHHEE